MCYIRVLAPPVSQTVSRGGLAWIEHPLLGRFAWLVHAFSTRRVGVERGPSPGLNLGFTAGDRNAYQNQDILSFAITPEPVWGQLAIPLAMLLVAIGVTRSWQRTAK